MNDYDRFNGENLTCRKCNKQSADCRCDEFEAVDADEYDGEFDDEGD